MLNENVLSVQILNNLKSQTIVRRTGYRLSCRINSILTMQTKLKIDRLIKRIKGHLQFGLDEAGVAFLGVLQQLFDRDDCA